MTNKPLRVLAISRAFGEHAGGMERLSFELLRALKPDPALKLTTIINHTPPNLSLRQARQRSVWFAITALPRALMIARQADVIHLGDPVLSFIGWTIKTIYKKPVVVTVHGLDVTFKNTPYQLYLRVFFRHFEAYLPISTHAAEALQHHHVSGHVQVIHPGINDRFYDPALTRDSLEKLLSRSLSNNRILLTVGRLVPRKGHAWFINEVLPHLSANTLYIIAGDGPEHDNIQHTIKTNVLLLGRISNADVRILYNTVDAFIQPNISTPGDPEGFGLAMLEAGLCERPVFASNLEGIRDAITDGYNGTLLPAGDTDAWVTALNKFLSNPNPNPAARTYTLSHFSWTQPARSYHLRFADLVSAART